MNGHSFNYILCQEKEVIAWILFGDKRAQWFLRFTNMTSESIKIQQNTLLQSLGITLFVPSPAIFKVILLSVS